ncbi:MAG TPA: ferritin-like domain-containing protein [Vicinamibacterales bacterium]
MSDRSSVDRRSFLRTTGASTIGLASLAAIGSGPLVAKTAAATQDKANPDNKKDKPSKGDIQILIAAEIAEALAVTTYTSIINFAPFFARIPGDDQGYLEAARQEEMSHYLLEQSVTGQPSPFSIFYYPPGMFESAQTTLNVLVTLEDAFIAAYLVGVRQFSTPDFRVTAARIMGIESDHRTLARVIGPDVAPIDGGPIAEITGIQGTAESTAPPNNNGYERTLLWTNIDQALAALQPFVDLAAASKAGFDISRPYVFAPFTPTLPQALGDFHSFLG